MIVENGSVTMDLDLNQLNGTGAMTRKLETVRFAVAAKSFFSILVFNDLLRGPEQGSMALIPQNSPTLSAALSASLNQLTVEKLPSTQQFDLAVRDAKTASSSSISRDINTITMPMRSYSASMAEGS